MDTSNPRKRQMTDDFIERSSGDAKRRRIDLSVMKRKRVPTGTYIGTEDVDILAIGVPTKKGKIQKYIISTDGTASADSIQTTSEFTAGYSIVYVTTRPTTLSNDGTVEPNRLSQNLKTIKEGTVEEKNKEEKTEPTEEKTEPTKEKVNAAPETAQKEQEPEKPSEPESKPGKEEEKVMDTETSEEIVTERTNETIAKEVFSGPTSVSKNTSNVPQEKDLSVLGIKRMFLNSLDDKIQALLHDDPNELLETTVEKAVQVSSEIEKLEAELKFKTDKQEKEQIQVENEIIKEVTDKTVDMFDKDNKSAEADLSKGDAVSPIATSVDTGATVDMDISHQLTKEAIQSVELEGENNPTDDVDRNQSNENNITDELILGNKAPNSVLEGVHTSSISTSANAMAAIDTVTTDIEMKEMTKEEKESTSMDVDENQQTRSAAEKEAERKQAEFAKDIKESAAGQARKRMESAKGKIDPEERMKMSDEIRAKEKTMSLELLTSGGNIQGFNLLMEQLMGEGYIKDSQDIKTRRRILAILRKDNKMINIKTAKAPSEEEIFQEVVGSKSDLLGTPGVPGTSGVGTPVFTPDTSRNDLYQMQHGVATLTELEAKQLREELTPLWNEFKLGRMAAGVREMERMPTRLLRSDNSTLKAASKIREDIKKEEESFGHFMYWLLHDKLNTLLMSTWRGFLLYSAAMGYNDLTQAQINWIITGNENGDLTATTKFSKIQAEFMGESPLDATIDVRGKKLTQTTALRLHEQVVGNPEPQAQYPSRNTSPSAAPVDGSIHPDGSSGPERANRSELTTIPSSVINIPDPRFSKRGGIDVPNIRIATIKNPKYDPVKQKDLKPGDKGYEPPYITQEVPDIGAGSKDIQARINQAEADRLLQSIPSKLYAPIHAQACDRYLGSLNYQRLSLPIEQYMKSYSQHEWGPNDYQLMYNWNFYTMSLYGEMLYAFVTDIQMQRTSPVFDMSTPEAVGDEYMELNELINELEKFQQNSTDRADRIADSGAGARPLEDHLNKFFQDQSSLDKEKLFGGNTAIISLPDTPYPSGGGVTPAPTPTPTPPAPATPWPGGGPDPRYRPEDPWSPENDRRPDQSKPLSKDNDMLDPDPDENAMFSASRNQGIVKNQFTIGAVQMDQGIKRSKEPNYVSTEDQEMERRKHIYNMFKGR